MSFSETIVENKRSLIVLCCAVVIAFGGLGMWLLVSAKRGAPSNASPSGTSASNPQQPTPTAAQPVNAPADIVLGMSSLLLTDAVALAPPADPNSVYGTDMLQDQHTVGANGQWSEAPVSGPERFAEWTFTSDAGSYQIISTYAAAESRPLTLSVNGTVVLTSTFSTLTGGWNPENRQTIPLGTVTLGSGTKVLRISCPANQAFPHVKEIRLARVTAS